MRPLKQSLQLNGYHKSKQNCDFSFRVLHVDRKISSTLKGHWHTLHLDHFPNLWNITSSLPTVYTYYVVSQFLLSGEKVIWNFQNHLDFSDDIKINALIVFSLWIHIVLCSMAWGTWVSRGREPCDSFNENSMVLQIFTGELATFILRMWSCGTDSVVF